MTHPRTPTVLVTRPPPGGSELADLLEAEGIRALLFAAVEIVPPHDSAPLAAAALRAARGGFDWIVFTSAKGVQSFARALADGPAPPTPRARIAAVGPATAAAAAAEGWTVQLVPDAHTSEGLLEALTRVPSISGASVLMPVAERTREVLSAGLRAHGADVEEVVAYRTVPRTGPELDQVRALARGEELDLVTFASPSAVESFLEALGGEALSLRAAVIGPVTAEVAQRSGFEVVAVADPHTNAGLVRAVARWLGAAGPNDSD